MIRFCFQLALLFVLASSAIAVFPVSAEGAELVASASEQYVDTSEKELDKLVRVMHAFMRHPKDMRKAMAIMQATNDFEAVTAAGYTSAKASARDDEALNLALDNYRKYQLTLARGGFGHVDETEWKKMVAEARRLGDLVRAVARPNIPT